MRGPEMRTREDQDQTDKRPCWQDSEGLMTSDRRFRAVGPMSRLHAARASRNHPMPKVKQIEASSFNVSPELFHYAQPDTLVRFGAQKAHESRCADGLGDDVSSIYLMAIQTLVADRYFLLRYCGNPHFSSQAWGARRTAGAPAAGVLAYRRSSPALRYTSLRTDLQSKRRQVEEMILHTARRVNGDKAIADAKAVERCQKWLCPWEEGGAALDGAVHVKGYMPQATQSIP
jgi:hypothetical protein